MIVGASGFGREVAWLAESGKSHSRPCRVVAFADDDRRLQGKTVNGLPVLALDTLKGRYPMAQILIGVGNPGARESLSLRVSDLGFKFASVVHPNVECSKWVTLGEGTVVCAGCILTTNITLGRHVHVNLGCTVGHDVVIGDYATLSPGVHISGCVHVGERAFMGTGAVVVNGTRDRPVVIGDDAVVGAGACVTKSVPAGVTVVGVPARPTDSRGRQDA